MNNYSGDETVNIGTGKELTIKELTELVAKVVGYKGVIKWDTTKPNGTPRKLLNVNKLHGLGWNHKVELEEAINEQEVVVEAPEEVEYVDEDGNPVEGEVEYVDEDGNPVEGEVEYVDEDGNPVEGEVEYVDEDGNPVEEEIEIIEEETPSDTEETDSATQEEESVEENTPTEEAKENKDKETKETKKNKKTK